MTSSSAQEGNRARGSFVNRERELAELRAVLADVTSGHSHLFLLSGEPGIGKTRLADEFGRWAVAQGVRVVWGRCWEGSGAPAYWPWIQVLRACLADSDAEQRAAILGSEATPQVAQDIAQLLPELRAAHAPPRHLGPQPTDPEQARFQMFASVATLLKNVARIGPFLIVIDDLHDADHPSLLLMKFVAGHSKDARIMMVGTYRDTEVRQSQELARLIGDLSREGHSLPIVGLSQAEVEEFVANRSGRKVDERLIANLYEATDGHPLFVEGVVRLLAAEGRLDRAVAGDAFKIPDGVQESIRRRLVKLPEETNLVLSIASVIGNEVETQLVARVSGSPAEEIVERMEGALRAGIVVDSPIGGSHYRFSHALVGEALYQDLPTNRRIQLHAEIGAAIEEVHKDDPKPHLAALAHHFRAAGNVRRAIDYSIAASDAAEAVFAYEDALSHLRPALAIAETHDHDAARRAALLLRLGRIIVFFENHERGVAYLESALKIFEQIGDKLHAGEALSHLGHVFGPFGPQMDVRRGLMHLHRAETLLGEASEAHSLGQLYWGLAMANFEAMRINEALSASQKAMDIFARLGNRELWARAAAIHSPCLMVKGKLTEAIGLWDEIGGAAAGFVNPDAYRHVTWLCGWFWAFMNAPGEALRYYKLCLKRPGHDTRLNGALVQFLTNSETSAGNLTEAKRLAAENSVTPVYETRIAYFEGDWKAAAEGIEKALDWPRRIGSVWNELGALSYLVDLLRVTCDYPAASTAFERAFSLYQPEDLYWEANLRPQAVLLYFDAGQCEKVAEHLQYCRKIVAGAEDWLGRAGPVWRAEAIGAALQDHFEESDRYFEQSIENFRQYSLPWDEAETLHYWGKVLLKAGQPQRALEKLDAAIKIYRDHGSGQAWIDRVDADRRRAGPPSAEPQLQSGPAEAKAATRDAVFRNEGDFWTISYVDRRFRLRDMRGLHYIAYLLGHPSERFHVRELSAILGGDAFSIASSTAGIQAGRENAPPILDSKAKADYRARLSELRTDLDEAERMNDTGRAERIRRELEFVNDELSVAVGLSGRDRRVSDTAERARKRIGKAIRSALSGIREHDPSLAHHLTTCIRTGYYCTYFSDPQQPLSWKL
jgi:tetratricopeptide (TPR) repeat protein